MFFSSLQQLCARALHPPVQIYAKGEMFWT